MQVEGHRAGSSGPVAATGGWVSNAYPTCPALGDSPWKRGLIPDGAVWTHVRMAKVPAARDGDASD